MVKTIEELIGDDGELVPDREVPQEGEESLLAKAQELMRDPGARGALEEAIESLVGRPHPLAVLRLFEHSRAHLGGCEAEKGWSPCERAELVERDHESIRRGWGLDGRAKSIRQPGVIRCDTNASLATDLEGRTRDGIERGGGLIEPAHVPARSEDARCGANAL
jgi:hypothetical protein